MRRCFVVAEVGVNHNCDFDMVEALIGVAADCKADAVKFQTAVPELVVTKTAPMALYQQKNLHIPNQEARNYTTKSQLEMLKEVTLPLDSFSEIKAVCAQKGITFFSTAFDLVSLSLLENLGQPCHKIPSGEITNLPYLRQIGGYGKPLIMSTGMANMSEIANAVRVVIEAGTDRENLTILHCSTAYPTEFSDVNLKAMRTIGDTFSVKYGYSDHTLGFEVAVAAVAMGATVIEKHLTLDRRAAGPDHAASLEPEEFKEMVAAIRRVETILGSDEKKPSVSELENIPIVRRSIVAARPISKGEMFTTNNIVAKRPGTGLSAMMWDDVIGQSASRDFASDEMIEL